MATHMEMWSSLVNFMNERYRNISSLFNSDGYRIRHITMNELYAYLAGRYPDESISRCYSVVRDICDYCSKLSVVYPYPDGELWTAGELEKYIGWRDETWL